jgi:4-amino-4-deoxy-L-arabinose transferase-like glycosyltransferase
MSHAAWQKLRLHWPFAAVALIGLTLVLSGLSKDYLWADEGDTAVFAENIIRSGVPKAWDGITFVDSDKGARLNRDLVMVTSPWLQYYATAVSFFVFGKSTFSARLPFAIAGWLTILFAYRLALQTTASRWAAFCAAAILVGSVQFLLYCRQCRYYALSMLLTLLLVSIFLKMKSARHCALFAVTAVLLFHAHPISAAPLAALGVLTIVYRPFSIQRRWFWIAAPAIVALTLPWVFLGGSGYAESMGNVQSVPQFIGRCVQYLIECASVTPLVGVAVIALLCGLHGYRDKNSNALPTSLAPELSADNQSNILVVFTFVALLLYALTVAATQPADSLWRIGIRYTTPMFPLVAISAGILIARISRGRTIPILALTAIVIFTKFAQLTPWIFWGKSVASFDGKEVIEAHLPNNIAERFLNTRQQLFFLSDLFASNPGTIATVSSFLREHSQSTDKLITNYEWEPLYFHTGLPQALKILPDYPIYQAAKSKGLPSYVFDVDQVRWVIWRPAWDGYQEYFASAIQQEIVDRGGHIERVAEVPETLWENRENIHFRRFSGGRYLFHGPETFPPASIFRVSWPATY